MRLSNGWRIEKIVAGRRVKTEGAGECVVGKREQYKAEIRCTCTRSGITERRLSGDDRERGSLQGDRQKEWKRRGETRRVKK